ncbi:MAG: DUF4336 domain-containing protein [Myxococcota bacterium]
MRELHADLWVDESPLRFLGLEVGARMTVVRLPNGELLLHSPIRLDADLRAEVEGLGPVAYLVAPNKLHHLFLDDWIAAFPDAALYLAPGLAEKRTDLAPTGVLGDAAEPAWAEVLDQVALGGFSFANEVVFFHRPSQTLILTDTAFNVGPEGAPLTRAFFKLAGVYGTLSPTLVEKLLIRNRDAFRAGLERVLSWPFERVVVSHGAVKEKGGREELLRGYAWLLEG